MTEILPLNFLISVRVSVASLTGKVRVWVTKFRKAMTHPQCPNAWPISGASIQETRTRISAPQSTRSQELP
jgi:hypothetical protein